MAKARRASSAATAGAWQIALSVTALSSVLACSGAPRNDATRNDARAPAAPDNAAAQTVAGLLPSGPASVPHSTGSDTALPATAVSMPTDTAPGGAANDSGFVTFADPDSDFATEDVRDADRQVMHFDASGQALIWNDNGDRVSGWVSQGNDLVWSGSGIPFRVRFGTEGGARRAYFTEAGSGTICNLEVSGPEQLSISATSELPPND